PDLDRVGTLTSHQAGAVEGIRSDYGGALPTEIAVEGSDTRRGMVAPAVILGFTNALSDG
ncbi:MAG TPA: hypothetical protein VFN63_16570, partial [Pseudolabrys sp.]|nr:hypothetical protein [Pseudolabrys sp.]